MKIDRILVVDDKEENRYLMRTLLQGNGYEVDEAHQGAEALEIARKNPPDLIIADILMPVMDGFTLCRQWKKDERLKIIPFVFYTATYIDERDRQFAMSLGAERFIVKPQEPEVFMAIVREAIRQVGSPPAAPAKPATDVPILLPEEEPAYLKQYNAVLIRKLETKMEELEKGIIARKIAEASQRESESHFRELFDRAGIGIVTADSEARILESNPELDRMLGYGPGELRGIPFIQLTHPDDLAKTNEFIRRLHAEPNERHLIEKRYIRKDGGVVWTNVCVTAVTNGNGAPAFFMGMVEDITSHKAAQDEIKTYQQMLRSITARSSLTEQRERRKIAIELHDRIGHSLTLAKLKVETMAAGNSADPKLSKPLAELATLLEETINATSSLTFELSSPILYELGLEAALGWLADHTQKQHGFRVTFENDGFASPMTDDFKVLLFQTAKELLFNIVKHAGAKHAGIILRHYPDHVKLLVVDDGCGFNPLAVSPYGNRSGGFGILSIKERLSSIGGVLSIRSKVGAGTHIELIVPLDKKEDL